MGRNVKEGSEDAYQRTEDWKDEKNFGEEGDGASEEKNHRGGRQEKKGTTKTDQSFRETGRINHEQGRKDWVRRVEI